jgi:MFS family permease
MRVRNDIVASQRGKGRTGLGGAFLLTASLAIIGNAFKGAERTRAYAFWGASLGIALAIGPVVGGIITDTVGWRWGVLVNVPLCVLLIAATFKFIDESRDPGAKRLDFAGIVTFSLGLALMVWGLIDGTARLRHRAVVKNEFQDPVPHRA